MVFRRLIIQKKKKDKKNLSILITYITLLK